MNKIGILLITLLLLIAGGYVAYNMYNKPHRDIAAESTDFKITADELYSQYELNEQASNEKYLDKVIEVSGKIEDIEKTEGGNTTLILTAAEAMMGGISATLHNSQAGVAAAMKSGDEVKLKCRCTGKLMDVVLVDCSVPQ